MAAAIASTDLVNEAELVLALEKMVSLRQNKFDKLFEEDKKKKLDLLKELEVALRLCRDRT